MKAAVLFSGGKDSTYAAYMAIGEGYKVECLLSLVSDNKASYMFHTANIEFAEKQAEAMEIPLLIFETKGEKEAELEDLRNAIKFAMEKHHINTLIVGAIASKYQYDRVKNIADELKIDVFSPIWKVDPEQYLDDLVKARFEVVISAIAAEGLTKDFLGKRIDHNMIERLKELNRKHHIHVAGEGGEYETFVTDCPLFKKRIKILKSETNMENVNTGLLVIKEVKLVDK
ncbi:TIGR00289 family protein [Candidatus Woesearchaeota archaeon CG10_big_fil_rev_8_21_14_0_10_44_13]|nr:MAG: TIGR00289 family protein [Candidatus Woesearchaeota archaeon CG10_big_fil_rev_8_21_14_0_10_44_13]